MTNTFAFDFKGSQFANFTYTNGEGVISNYHVILGSSYEKAQLKNVEILKNASFDDEGLEIARLDILAKALANLNPKTQSNQSKAQCDTYQHLHKGIKMHIGIKSPQLNGNIYIGAVIINKKQTPEQIKQSEINIASGNFKPKKVTKHGQKVLNKKEVSKTLGLHALQYGNFKFEKGSLESARVNGEILEM
tara:strand:+ start:287 stop:859 length:573 start_codon:yes stop_codon:yes gene_type:complete